MNQKNLQKSIEIAKQLFPTCYAKRVRYQTFHFAFLWKKNRLISIGQNRVDKPSAKALYFAKRFNVEKQKKYPYIHAEISAIQKVWSKVYIDNSISMVVLRLSRDETFQNSKPCKGCWTILSALGIDDVCWSDASGNIVSGDTILLEQDIIS